MALRAYDPHLSVEWSHEDYPEARCKLRPLTAREVTEVQGENLALGMLETARRGIFSCVGVENPDGTPRVLKLDRTPSGRGIVPDEWLEGLPTDWWAEAALEIARMSGIDTAADEDAEGSEAKN